MGTMLALLLLALAQPLPPAAMPTAMPATASPPTCSAPDSLEEFLRMARARKEERLAALRGPVAEMVVRLEERGRPGPLREMERIRKELDGLGTESALLLLPHIDPGLPVTGATKFRAEEVTEALIRMHTASVTEPLIEIAADAGRRARLNAIRILGHAPDRTRAGHFLVGLFRANTGQVRLECVIALSRMGGAENAEVLREALNDDNAAVVAAVLNALAGAQAVDAVDGVRALVRNPTQAASVIPDLLGYFRACPATATREAMVELLQLAAGSNSLAKDQRLEILDAVPPFEPPLDAEVRAALDPLLGNGDVDLQEGAQICLALLGDRGVRRELRKKYDDWVREELNWSASIEKRALLLLKLHEYTDAAKDFKNAIAVRQGRGQTVPSELHVSLARSYVLGGKLRQGSEALKEAYLSRGQLADLATDPDFKDLVESSRYGKIFE